MSIAGFRGLSGGGSALSAAFSQAQKNVSNGTDLASQLGQKLTGGFSGGGGGGGGSTSNGGSGSGSGGGGPSGGVSSGSDTPYSTAAGFATTKLSSSSIAKLGRVVADATANLGVGTAKVAKDAVKDRLSTTTGGKIAGAIREMGAQKNSNGDNIDDEIASFRDKKS